MKKNDDALTNRARIAKRNRIRRNILRTLACLLVLMFVLFKFIIGVAYYHSDSLSPIIPGNSGIVYLKLSNQYNSSDIIIFKNIASDKVLMASAEDYEKDLKNAEANQSKIMGKVIWHLQIGVLN